MFSIHSSNVCSWEDFARECFFFQLWNLKGKLSIGGEGGMVLPYLIYTRSWHWRVYGVLASPSWKVYTILLPSVLKVFPIFHKQGKILRAVSFFSKPATRARTVLSLIIFSSIWCYKNHLSINVMTAFWESNAWWFFVQFNCRDALTGFWMDETSWFLWLEWPIKKFQSL